MLFGVCVSRRNFYFIVSNLSRQLTHKTFTVIQIIIIFGLYNRKLSKKSYVVGIYWNRLSETILKDTTAYGFQTI